MQSSPPTSEGKSRALRELSRSLMHSPRDLPQPSPAPSDSNPTKYTGFGTETSEFFDNPDVLVSTVHRLEEDTNTLPQYPRIRSTAKKQNTWQPFRPEQVNVDTSMVNKEFGDFDHSLSDEDHFSVEQARGGYRSNRGTPSKMSSQFNSLYDMTPPTNRSRKSYAAETGSLRRDAQIRRASRNDMDTASPRPASKRNSPAVPTDRKRTSLAQLHAKVSEDESSFIQERPPTLTIDSTKNTRWGNRSRQTSLQTDGVVDASPRVHTKSQSRSGNTQNATAQSFILPDLPNLTELVSGVFDDGTPVFSKTAPARSRFAAPPNGGRKPQYTPVEGVPIPDEEKAIFVALQMLQDRVAQIEHERSVQEKKIEEQELELIELRATTKAQNKLGRSDSSNADGKGSWTVEKTRLDATVQTLGTKPDRADRKVAVLEIEKKRLASERDNMATQLGVAFQTCEELKNEKHALSSENDALRREVDNLQTDNDALRDQLDQELSQHREETVQLRDQFNSAANATEKENATLHEELARVRAQHDENTQQLSRKDVELRKARQEQAEFARLKADHESLKSQLENLKVKREEDAKRWSRSQTALQAQVGRRDETIRHFEDMTQGETNEAMRLDNENLRQELEQLAAQQQEDNELWARKEAEMKRKIRHRENEIHSVREMTRDILSTREAPISAGRENVVDDTFQRRPSYRREDTRTRIKNRVQQEVRNSRPLSASQQPSRVEETPRKSHTGHSRFSQRSVSAPVPSDKHARVESGAESTTDLSLAPRETPYTARSMASVKPSTRVQPPADLSLTELSYIDSNQIAQLRRALEEERIAARHSASSAPLEQVVREETVQPQRQARDDTGRSVASARSERRPSLPRKSSLKEATQRTIATQFEEDATGKMSNLDADGEATQTKDSIIDASMLSNTSRRRRGMRNEMTSAFIVPDIKIESRKQNTGTLNITHNPANKDHDNTNCTVCRREGLTLSTNDLRVPKLIPVSSRTADDIDATMRPARSPKEALAFVVKELQDERAHLHLELAITRATLETHDPSQGNRKRHEINESIREMLRRLEIKDMQIYNLYDVLEGQQNDHELTELDVEELTREIRNEDEAAEGEKKKSKKVTIRSFVDEDSVEVGRGGRDDLEEQTEDLPWEGFEDTGMEGDHSFGAVAAWKTSVRA